MLCLLALLPLRRARSAQALDTIPVRPDLSIHPRDSWGEQLPPKLPLNPEPDVRFVLVHHTAGKTDYGPNEVADQIRQIYAYQTGPKKGWPDVCYHFFVDRFGGVWEGRAGSLDGPVVADATGGNQGFAQLVCLLGNFHEQPATAQMIHSLELVIAWIADRYELDTTPDAATTFVSRGSNKWPEGTEVNARIISGHRDMSQTVCPGDFVYPLLETDVPAAVEALRSQQQPVVSDDPGEAAAPSTSTAPPATSAPPESSQAPQTTPLSTATTESTVMPAGPTAAPTSQATNPAATSDGGRNTGTLIAGGVVAGGALVSIGALAAARQHRNSTQERNQAREGFGPDDGADSTQPWKDEPPCR